MDAGGRATQEQLPSAGFACSQAELALHVMVYSHAAPPYWQPLFSPLTVGRFFEKKITAAICYVITYRLMQNTIPRLLIVRVC